MVAKLTPIFSSQIEKFITYKIMVILYSVGHTTAHHCCAAWSEGVCQNENMQLINVVSQSTTFDKYHLTVVTHRSWDCALGPDFKILSWY